MKGNLLKEKKTVGYFYYYTVLGFRTKRHSVIYDWWWRLGWGGGNMSGFPEMLGA